MKIIINLILMSFVVTSCSRNNDAPETIAPVEKTLYNFSYANSYKVNDIVLYKGPLGSKETPQEDFIKDTWISYSVPEYSQIDIDIKNQTIEFHIGKNTIKNTIEFSKDSIHISKDKVFVGILDKKNETLKLSKSFYYIKKNLGNSSFSFNRFTKLGITKYQDVFGINTFQNPSEMSNINDEVFWANLSYSYKQN